MSGFPEKIMIIDDDPSLLAIEELTLKRVGNFDIHTCESCEQAVAALDSFTPDMILLDLKMPRQDGTDMLRMLRTIPEAADIPVVFVTAETRVSMREEYTRLGVIGVIHKPFQPASFIRSVQQFWQAYRYAA